MFLLPLTASVFLEVQQEGKGRVGGMERGSVDDHEAKTNQVGSVDETRHGILPPTFSQPIPISHLHYINAYHGLT